MPPRPARHRRSCRWPGAESGGGASPAFSSQNHEPMIDPRPARLPVKLDGVGPWDDRSIIPKAPQIGERRQKQLPSQAAAAMRPSDASRPEEPEPFVVRVMRGEAGDFPFVL